MLLRDLSRELKRQATLNDVPDSLLDRLARAGFDWLWFLGVWQTGAAGRRVSREHHEWQTQFREILPDFEVLASRSLPTRRILILAEI